MCPLWVQRVEPLHHPRFNLGFFLSGIVEMTKLFFTISTNFYQFPLISINFYKFLSISIVLLSYYYCITIVLPSYYYCITIYYYCFQPPIEVQTGFSQRLLNYLNLLINFLLINLQSAIYNLQFLHLLINLINFIS